MTVPSLSTSGPQTKRSDEGRRGEENLAHHGELSYGKTLVALGVFSSLSSIEAALPKKLRMPQKTLEDLTGNFEEKPQSLPFVVEE